tara:strand:- start:23047 stop:23403 length:357 start_codon:yes stop_codon:yes gene_type:complete
MKIHLVNSFLFLACYLFNTTAVAQSSDERFSQKLEQSSLPQHEKMMLEERRKFLRESSRLETLARRGAPELYVELGDLYYKPSQFQDRNKALEYYQKAQQLNVMGVNAKIEKLKQEIQ